MAISPQIVRAACRHLRRSDPVMRRMMDDVGAFTLRPDRDRFGMLVRSIISQQISVGAARAIRQRLLQQIAPDRLQPETLLRLDMDQLRSVGLSLQKATYLRDLSARASDGTVHLRTIGRYSDEQVIAQLTQVKGVGHWTAQMFLIFALGRLDVFPHGDLGVRVAIRDRYGLPDLPDRETGLAIASAWRPFATVASWYCWRTLDLRRAAKPTRAATQPPPGQRRR
ncbi:MAG: DNA-3-methyladenine glycosylase 2 family protein [Pirellulaceae bacterium]|nr:DNA-3-methyladenine glycosylase 2 family protein [Pirellulaceae bacterium]